jgi:hypothetical protein
MAYSWILPKIEQTALHRIDCTALQNIFQKYSKLPSTILIAPPSKTSSKPEHYNINKRSMTLQASYFFMEKNMSK